MNKQIDKDIALILDLEEKILGKKPRQTTDLMEILKTMNKQKGGVILNLPWKAELNGEYHNYLQVVAVKVTKDTLYYYSPLKTSKVTATGIEEGNGMETMSLKQLLEIHKREPIVGILES